MKRILFLIHDLGHGGAEKVLVNLVNNMDAEQFDITVLALFGGGVNRQFLKPHIHCRTVFPKAFPGNSHAMKLFSPRVLHKWFIREKYDIEVAYLEGPCARIISGCPDPDVKKVAWIHSTMASEKQAARSFRNRGEACACYGNMDKLVFVSQGVRDAFLRGCPVCGETAVLYNTNESARIRELAAEAAEPGLLLPDEIRLVGVGKLVRSKGFHRLIPMVKRLRDDGLPAHLYLLGTGPKKAELEELALRLGVEKAVTFLGYQTNPYKYVAKCDLFVCASFAEGFSTAATEALIAGTPVCTVDVSGMKEMLGNDNEWGVVTENEDEALYLGLKHLLQDPVRLARYKEKAAIRGKTFSTEYTVKAVEQMLLCL